MSKPLPNDAWHHARKPKACECCNRVIRVGQAYYRPMGPESFCSTVCYELWCKEDSAIFQDDLANPPRRPFPVEQ